MFKRRKQIINAYESALVELERSNGLLLDKFEDLTDSDIYRVLSADRKVIQSCNDIINFYKNKED